MMSAVLLCLALFAAGGGAAAMVRYAGPHDGIDGHTIESGGQRQADVRRLLETRYYRPLSPAALDTATASPTLTGLSATLGDPYTVYLPPAERAQWARSDAGRYVGIGVVLASDPVGEAVVSELVDGGPAERAGMRLGDIITDVDGSSVRGRPTEAVLDAVRGPAAAPVTVGWHGPDGLQRVAQLVRKELAARLVTGHLIVEAGHRVGVVSLREFDTGVGEQVRTSVSRLRAQGADVFVLDLRGDGGGLLAETLGVTSAFLDQGASVFTERGEHLPTHDYRTSLPPVDAVTPLAVLVDGSTASAAEIVAAALRDDGRARLVGSRTFGKGVIQDIEPLLDGGALKITVAEYLTPAGTSIDRRGLNPDVTSPPSAGALPPDPTLEIAVQAALSAPSSR
jgi:carboxyl-terminal processing protease